MSGDRETRRKDAAVVWGEIKRLGSYLPSPIILFVIAVLVWLLTGVFVVGPDEVGVVKTFGREARTEEAGIHYHLPWPISEVLTPKIKRIHRMEIGYRVVEPVAGRATPEDPPEALMLTGDENIVDLRFIVQYRIKDVDLYLFHLADQEITMRAAAGAAMRAAVGHARIDDVLTTGRRALVDEVLADLRATLDHYKAGVEVLALQLQSAQPPEEVQAAFKGVVSAREKMNEIVNEARMYANEIVPEAMGRARTIEREAEAYLEEKRLRAQGEADRFLMLLEESRKARDVTRTRLYLEAMEEVLSRAGAIVLEPENQTLMPFPWDPRNPEAGTVPGPTR